MPYSFFYFHASDFDVMLKNNSTIWNLFNFFKLVRWYPFALTLMKTGDLCGY